MWRLRWKSDGECQTYLKLRKKCRMVITSPRSTVLRWWCVGPWGLCGPLKGYTRLNHFYSSIKTSFAFVTAKISMVHKSVFQKQSSIGSRWKAEPGINAQLPSIKPDKKEILDHKKQCCSIHTRRIEGWEFFLNKSMFTCIRFIIARYST